MRTRFVAILIGLTVVLVGCTTPPAQGAGATAPATAPATPAPASHAPSYGTGY